MKYKKIKLTNNNELIYALKICVFSLASTILILSIARNSDESSFYKTSYYTEAGQIQFNYIS